MLNEIYRNKIKELINTAKDKGLVKTYSTICETENIKKYTLSEDEVNYYTSLNNKDTKKFKIGDIVFVYDK